MNHMKNKVFKKLNFFLIIISNTISVKNFKG